MTFHKLIGIHVNGEACEPSPMIHRYRYGPWRIELDPYSVSPAMDWAWWHDDFDGAPDANDSRYGREPSLNAALDAIDDLEAAQ